MLLRAHLIVGASILFAVPALAREMTVALQDGPAIEDAVRQVYLHPFSDSAGVPLTSVEWSGGMDGLHGSAWDVVLIRTADLAAACDQGLLEKLDWTAIGGRDHYLPQAITDCGVGAYTRSLVLAWNPDKFPGTASWGDFWDVARIPGKRGLQQRARDTMEIALLADGVAPGDVYATLRGSDGVERAFRKLDQLKPYIVWWHDDSSPAKLITSGDVLMSSTPSELATQLHGGGRPLAIQWNASLYGITFWAILKASPHLADANRLLAYVADPARQAQLLSLAGLGGLAKGANDKLSPAQLALSPSAAANLANALRVDAGFWRDNGARLEAQFQAWVKK